MAQTGREFGITRERVRQIVNRAGINTARIVKPKPERSERFCKECGAPVNSNRARYCETHRTEEEKYKRRYRAIKADPIKYARWREMLNQSDRRRRARARAERRDRAKP